MSSEQKINPLLIKERMEFSKEDSANNRFTCGLQNLLVVGIYKLRKHNKRVSEFSSAEIAVLGVIEALVYYEGLLLVVY